MINKELKTLDKSICVVEDEPDMLNLLTLILTEKGYKVSGFLNGEDALNFIETNVPDLLILDLMLPGISGLDICVKVKSNANTSHIPIIILTSRSDEFDIINGLEFGCDDYITKPFNKNILLARIKNIIKRTSSETDEIIQVGDLAIDISRHEVSIKSKVISLTHLEFKTLCFLTQNKGKIFTREQILNNTHDSESFCNDRAIDVIITKIRKKIGFYGDYIESIYGMGYRFKDSNN